MKVGIINVTGYAGCELARILYRCPEVEIRSVTGRTAAGQKLGEVFPHLSALELIITPELDGKSGVSGAGRSLSLGTHYPEVNENTMAYSVGGHRHLAGDNPEYHLSDPPGPDDLGYP